MTPDEYVAALRTLAVDHAASDEPSPSWVAFQPWANRAWADTAWEMSRTRTDVRRPIVAQPASQRPTRRLLHLLACRMVDGLWHANESDNRDEVREWMRLRVRFVDVWCCLDGISDDHNVRFGRYLETDGRPDPVWIIEGEPITTGPAFEDGPGAALRHWQSKRAAI